MFRRVDHWPPGHPGEALARRAALVIKEPEPFMLSSNLGCSEDLIISSLVTRPGLRRSSGSPQNGCQKQ
jgi:hypothetical protein